MADRVALKPHWTTACPDWEQRILERRGLIAFPPLFQESADEAMSVFSELRIVDAPGSPKMGEVARPWVNDFVSAIFGSYDPDSGRRLITEYLLLISKKNGKSTDAAAIMLTALVLNWRQSAEFLILAPTIEIANNSFYPARDMVRAEPELSTLIQIQDHTRTLTHRTTGATLKIVAADSDAVSGKKATGVLVDELWLFGKKAEAENMLKEATGGLASRPEGFVIYCSTQSDTSPAGVWAQKLAYARGVRDGKIDDPRFLPVLYEFPEKMIEAKEHLNPKNFYVTNPNIGLSVDEVFLVREFNKAQEEGESSLQGFLAKHLNVQVGLVLKSNNWAGAFYWTRRSIGRYTLQEMLDQCEVVTAGVDGGGLDDLLALAFVGRNKTTSKWMGWVRAWAHPEVLELRKSELPRLKQFKEDGDLVFVTQMGEDVKELAELVAIVHKAQLLDKVGADPSGLGQTLDALDAADIPADKIVGVSQGWRMHGAIKTTERKLVEGSLVHCGQPIMEWAVGNAKVVPQGNAIVITKQASGTAKIDPLMALFNAVTLMSLNPPVPKPKHQLIILGGPA